MFRIPIAMFGLALASLALHAQAIGYSTGDPSGPIVLGSSDTERSQWSGIGRLYLKGGTQCMGTLIDSREPQGASSGPAYIATAGHCVSRRNGVIVQDQPIKARIAFNYFEGTPSGHRVFSTKRVIWSSMQGSDLALVELNDTLQAVMDQGIVPMQLGEPLATGSPVQLVGEPSGAGTGLRLSSCTEQDVQHVMEGIWVWRKLKLNDCPGVSDGSSGSPVIDPASHKVVGVVNSLVGTSVASVPVRRMLGCFKDGVADLTQQACELLPSFQLRQTSLDSFSILRRMTLDAQGNPQPPTWNVDFSLDTARYRYKTTRDPLACEAPEGYSGTLQSSHGRIDDAVAAEPGWHYLCVLGVESADDLSWPGLMANAVSLPMRVLEAGAVQPPQVDVERLDNGDMRLTWHLQPPHIARYRIKRGPPTTTDCEDLKGYGRQGNQSYTFKAETLPVKVCTLAIDGLKESSAPRTDVLHASAG